MNDTHTHKKHPDQFIELSAICGELLAAGVQPPAGGLRWLQVKAGSAVFPAEKRNNRWHVLRRDLPHVARAYGAVWPEGE